MDGALEASGESSGTTVRLGTIGPYRLLEVLGRGGMGVVYRARRLDSGETVALKTVRVPHESLLQSLRREIHTLSRLRHPGIVRIVEEGVHEGLPWYAMELLEAPTLREYIGTLEAAQGWWTGAMAGSTWWSHREAHFLPSGPSTVTAATEQAVLASRPPPGALRPPLPSTGLGVAPQRPAAAAGALLPALSLLRRLCGTLAFLHGEGIVHRDLKPENILLLPDAELVGPERPAGLHAIPVVVDFGLISQFGGEISREALDVAGDVAGTALYMAPEQHLGELPDARADLYALGCILYELLTGRRPFPGRTRAEVRRAHLEASPPRPSDLVHGIPPQLEELVLRLLAKRPRERLGHAQDVAAVLAALGASGDWPSSAPRPRAYLYRPGLAGRDAVLLRLEQCLQTAESGAGSLVLVAGESGVGKTRLVKELAREAQGRGLAVLAGECLPSGAGAQSGAGGRPLEALRRPLQALADRCREHGEPETQRLFGRRGKVLALYEPALQGLPGQVEAQEVAPLPAAASRLRLFGYLAETFEALAQAPGGAAGRAPVLLLLDDLQWADELTLGWLAFLLRGEHLRRMPLLVVGTYRTEEVGTRPVSILRELLDEPHVLQVALLRLEEAAVVAMVGDMLALEPPPRSFSRFLARQSEGNPFFVAEYLRGALAEGLLGRDEQGRWRMSEAGEGEALEADYETLALPHSLRELVGRRLEGLPEAAARLAQAAAVVGRQASVSLLDRMLCSDLPDWIGATAELLRRQVLEEGPPGELRFVHDKIREVAYERIAPSRRLDLHLAAAEGIEALLGKEAHLAALGHHREHAGDPQRARECYLAAARDASSHYAHADAERLCRAYLALVRTADSESIEARSELGRSVLSQGRAEEALQEHRRALEEARTLEHRDAEAQSLLSLGLTSFYARNMDEARSLLEQATRTARGAGVRRVEAQALAHLAGLHLEQGRLDEARSACQQSLALNRDSGDRQSEALALYNLGRICVLQSSPEAVSFYSQALDIHRELGDRRMQVFDLLGLGTFETAIDRHEEGRPFYEQALPLAREVGDLRMEGIVLVNLADNAADLGRLAAARAFCEQAMPIHRAAGDRLGEVMNLQVLTALERRLGALEAAESLLGQSEDLLRDLGQAYLNLAGLGQRGHLALARDQPARGFLLQAKELAVQLEVAPGDQLGQPIARLERAIEAFERGEHGRLFRGECVEGLPEALRRQLERTGQL